MPDKINPDSNLPLPAPAQAPNPTSPAPGPSPASAPVPAPDPVKPIETGADDPLLKVLFADLQLEPKPPEVKLEPPPTTPPAPAAPAVTPAAPMPAPAPPKIEVSRKPKMADLVQEQVRQAMESIAKPKPEPAPAAPSPAPTVPTDDLSGWEPDEIEALELARYAQSAMPEVYAGQVDKVKAFKRDLEEYLAKAKAADPERTLDAQDEEYTAWMEAHRPAYRPGEARKLERRMIEEGAAARAEEKVSAKFGEITQQMHVMQVLPQVKSAMTAFADGLTEMLGQQDETAGILPELVAKVKEGGLEQTMTEYPLQTRAALDTYRAATNCAGEFLSLAKGIKEWDAQNPVHGWLYEFFRRQEDFTASRPEKDQVRDGKRFLPRSQYFELAQKQPDKLAGHWTFSDEDMLRMLMINAKQDAAGRVKKIDEELKAAGYSKPTPAPKPLGQDPVPVPSPIPAPVPALAKSPRTTPSQSPGSALPAPVSPGLSMMSETEMRLLGLKD